MKHELFPSSENIEEPASLDRPPGCRATGPSGTRTQFFTKIFTDKPLSPGSGATRCRPPNSWAAGVYSCKFRKRKYIFVKNENEKYKKNRLYFSGTSSAMALFGTATYNCASRFCERGSAAAFRNHGRTVDFFKLHTAGFTQSRVRRKVFGRIIPLIS